MQMVRTCPNIERNQSPKVNDRQTVRVDWAFSLFRNKVVHHA
ncbi:Uncharacterised protein [Vibrio cholerae]|nr:Uncharacterised protein [Vibrio cholerae]CSI22147.1 Uncharacterised protein [Vibrio cholerae]